MKNSINGKYYWVILDTYFSPLSPVHCYSQVDSILTFIQTILSNSHPWNAFDRNDKVTCEFFVTQKTRINHARHKKRSLLGLLYCSKCPNSSTKSQSNLNNHIAKKQNASKLVATFKCKLCYQEFSGFNALRQHKITQHGFPIKIAKVDSDDMINELDDMKIEEELRSCHYFVVDSQLERARHKQVNYAIENLNATTVEEQIDHSF